VLQTENDNESSEEIVEVDISTDQNYPDDPADYIPMEHNPAKSRKILSNADRNCLIQQGPFQPKLTRYPRNPNIKDKNKQCSFSSAWYKQYPYLEYSLHSHRAYCFVRLPGEDETVRQRTTDAA
jgi:hypothetical protein